MYVKSYEEQSPLIWNIKDFFAWIQVDPKQNRLMSLWDQIHWDSICEIVSEAYSPKAWRNSIPLRVMIWLEYYKHIMGWISDRVLVEELQTNFALRYFCGIEQVHICVAINSSSMTKFRNRITNHEKGEEIMKKIQAIHVQEMVRKLPKKVQSQYDQDGTVIEEKVAYPTDVNLIYKVVEKWTECIKNVKKLLGSVYDAVCSKGKRLAEKVYYEYQFAKHKRKEIAEDTKKTLIKVANSSLYTLKRLYNAVEAKVTKYEQKLDAWASMAKAVLEQIQYHLDVWSKIIQQQAEMVTTWIRSCKDRIVSYCRSYVRPIVKWKAWKKVQFGAKVWVWVIGWKVAVAVSHNRDNHHETNDAIEWLDVFKQCMGKDPHELWYDRGWRWKTLSEELEKRWINNYVQWTKEFESLPKTKQKRLYNRRAFSENIINDILNHRWVKGNTHGKNNSFWRFMVGTMTSNIVRLRYL